MTRSLTAITSSAWENRIGHFFAMLSELDELTHQLKVGLSCNFSAKRKSESPLTKNWHHQDLKVRIDKLTESINRSEPTSDFLRYLERTKDFSPYREIFAHGTFAIDGTSAAGATTYTAWLVRKKTAEDEPVQLDVIDEAHLDGIEARIRPLIREFRAELMKRFCGPLPAITPCQLDGTVAERYLHMIHRIGAFLVNIGSIEALLDTLCWEHWQPRSEVPKPSKESPRGGPWQQMNLSKKIDALRERTASDSNYDRLRSTLLEVQGLLSARNLIAHAHTYARRINSTRVNMGLLRHTRKGREFISENALVDLCARSAYLSLETSRRQAELSFYRPVA